MKYALSLFLILLGYQPLAFADKTLSESDLKGFWVPYRGSYYESPPEPSEMKKTEIALEFKSAKQVVLSWYYDGEMLALESTEFRKVGNLFYWKFVYDDAFYYELVLGGWELDSGSKLQFGHLYLVSDKNGLFNGWPVSLRPASANKSSKKDSASAAAS